MSMTLTPSSGPMASFAPDARAVSSTAPRRFPDLVTSGPPEDQGQQAYSVYTCGLLRGLQQRHVICDRSAAHVEDASELCVLDLHALGRLTQQLHRGHHMHGDAGGANGVPFGLQAAGGIDRQLAILLGPAFLDRARALPSRRQ